MASIASSEYVKKVNVEKPVLFVTRLKNYPTNEAAQEAFDSMKQCYSLMCGDTEVQADGTAFQAQLGGGNSVYLELNFDF